MSDITAIVCPNCGDTYDKSKAIGLDLLGSKCLRCGGWYIPYECEVVMDEIAFGAIGFKVER